MNPQRFQKLSIQLRKFVLLILYLLGLFMSLQVILGIGHLEPDTVHMIILWNNINEFGLSWIKDWLFTPDNWLFSLAPINFFLFWLFGAKPIVVILTGWIIFILSILISGLIALELGSKKSFYIVMLILIYMGLYSYSSGFISYATSHNITNLFGLFSIFLFIKFVKLQKIYFIVIIFFLQIISGLSDPWMIASYTLPLAIATFILFLKSNTSKEKIKYILFFFTMTTSIIIIKILFELIDFLPIAHFSLGSWEIINSNAIFLIKNLGGLFNLFPGVNTNFFISGFISLLAIFILSVISIYITFNRGLNDYNFSFLTFIFFSIGGILLAFLITDVIAGNHSARFLINIIYLVTIVIVVSITTNWYQISKQIKIFSVVIALLFIVSGIFSNSKFLKHPTFSLNDKHITDFIYFLTEHNLNYGYGPYWGSSANAITIVSNSNIIIRPVTFDKTSGKIRFTGRAQSSMRWYNKSDYPKDQKNFFVVVNNDGEECSSPELCIEGLKQQYSKPSRVLTYKDSLILVWDHPLIDWFNVESLKLIEIRKNILFNSSTVIFTGWSHEEETQRWSLGKESQIIFSAIDNYENFQGVLSLHIGTLGEQKIKVTINNKEIGYQKINSGDIIIKFKFNPEILNNEKINTIQFEFPNAHKPSDSDQRVLAMALKSFILE